VNLNKVKSELGIKLVLLITILSWVGFAARVVEKNKQITLAWREKLNI
jgi:hypothetical protein